MLGLILLFFLSPFSPMRFQTIKREEMKEYFFSENEEYAAQVSYDKGNSEFVPFRSFVLRDKKGEVLWQSDSFPYTLLDISNEGWTVGIFFDGPISGRAILNFYDPTGRKRGEEEIDFLNARSFSQNGQIYGVLDGKRGLRVFSREGKKLYNFGKGNYFALSPDGRICALADDSQITFYQEGRKIKSIPIPSPFLRQIKFSSGDLFGYLTKKELFIYRTGVWELAFHYSEKDPRWRLISFDISKDGDLVILGRAEDKGRGVLERRTRGEVLLFNLNGELLWQQELKYKTWNIFIPEVKFLDGKAFLVKTVEEIYEYRY